MNKINFFQIKKVLTIVLALFSINLSAKDRVELIWTVNTSFYSQLYIKVTEGETFTVNWGDGIIQTFPDGYLYQSHKYAVAGTYKVIAETNKEGCRLTLFAIPPECTSLIFFDCSALDTLYSVNSQLSQLNLSPFKNLVYFTCTNSKFSKLDLSPCTKLKELYCQGNPLLSELILGDKPNLGILACDNNNLFELDASGCSDLWDFICNNNKLKKIDMTDFKHYCFFDCSDNQLTHLDLTPLSSPYYEYSRIACYNNKLQLSDLYNAHLFSSGKFLGTQNLSAIGAHLDEELFADQSEFGGIFTKYVIVKDGAPALESDYTITEGKLTFHSRGIYTVTMTNDAIESYHEYPAKVIVTVNVSPVGVKENQLSDIIVYPNPTTGKLTINSEQLIINNVEVYDVYGRNLTPHTTYLSPQTSLDISHLPAGVYFLSVNGKTTKVVKY